MIYQLLFSATGRSKKVMDIIAGRWDGKKIEIDLTDPTQRIQLCSKILQKR